MSINDLKEWISFIWPFIWPIVTLLSTFTIVSFGKSILKHYAADRIDKFTKKTIIRVFAAITGYLVAIRFMGHIEHAGQWAIAVAILNIPIYSAILKYATAKRWMPLIALLKGRDLIVRQEGDKVTEKIMDDNDKTMSMKEYQRRQNDE